MKEDRKRLNRMMIKRVNVECGKKTTVMKIKWYKQKFQECRKNDGDHNPACCIILSENYLVLDVASLRER